MKTELTSHERDVACYRSALRDASSTKDEKELEVLEKAIDELAEIIGHDVAMPILEEEIARQQAARREAEAERDELLAKMETLMKEDLVAMTDAEILEHILEVLDTEIGPFASNTDWQEVWEMSDEDYAAVQEAVKRLKLA